MQDLIARITEEVMKRLSVPQAGGTLAVFTEYVFDAKGVGSYLKNNHASATCALFEGARFESELKTESVITQQEKQALAGKLNCFEKIVIITPPLWLLGEIARGDDSVFLAMLAIRPLLWGREVTILLDFEVPRIRRSAALLRISEYISALEEMGAKFVYLPQESRKDEPKDLVTEQDVKDAFKNEGRRIIIKPGAIVTQLAQDTAKECGVAIEI